MRKHTTHFAGCGCAEERIMVLAAEVERLRGALNAAYVYYSGPQDDSQVADLIREALAGKEAEG